MDKTAIRNFAIWARNKLISDVAYRAGLMGITADGIADKLPQSTNSVQFFDIGTSEPYQITGKEITQRSNLAFLIKRKAKSSDYSTAYTSIIEEVAYTWFNRLIAIRFMEVNDYLPSHVRVLSSESGKIEPDIVTSPFDVDLGITENESAKILELKQNNESDELFKLLFIKQCNKLSEILPRLFEKTDDYTELLFNCSYVDQEGIVYRLTHDIPEEDFDVNRGGQVEIIGWLYQSYIAEPKDRLINARKKYSDSDIPYVTQLFTPDWIVRYMVENSLGRLWVEGHTNRSSLLQDNWKFYFEEAEQEHDTQDKLSKIRTEYAKIRPEDLKFVDPCMGSGHILVYAFDVLMQIYESEGYNQRDAAVCILENNLFGLDIDARAAQLAYFAVMMKARQYNRRVLDGMHDCHVLAIHESNGMSMLQTYKALFGDHGDAALRLIHTFEDAKEYGSILSIPLSLEEIGELENRIKAIADNRSDDVEDLMIEELILNEFPPLLEQARIMVQKYDVVVTNPPYMNSSYMPDKLKNFAGHYFPGLENDLFSMFTRKSLEMVNEHGHIGLLMPYVWMFISSYKQMREYLDKTGTITTLVQLEYNAFEAACVPVAALTIAKHRVDYKGSYVRLADFPGVDQQEPKTVEAINDKSCYYRYSFNQNDARLIPDMPLIYWMSSEMMAKFRSEDLLGRFAKPKAGLATGNNELFERLWYEVILPKIGFNYSDVSETKDLKHKWFPCNSGGEYRKWYFNNEIVVDWYNDGEHIKMLRNKNGRPAARAQNTQFYFKEGLTWNKLSSSNFAVKHKASGFIYDDTSRSVFLDENSRLFYLLGLLCSKVVYKYLMMLNPTMSFTNSDIERIPYIFDDRECHVINRIVRENLNISQNDWDSFETSWDFKKHPLI